MICQKKHRYLPEWKNLPNLQDNNNGRHVCSACAYLEGFKDALNGKPKAKKLSTAIPESQAGTVRHKDANKAYIKGYDRGVELNA